MTPRKRIPYAANGLLDQAAMKITTSIHEQMVLVKARQVSLEERVGIPAQTVVALTEVLNVLKEIRELVENQPKDKNK